MTSADIKRRARELGFDRCGVATAGPHAELTFLGEWLDRGFAGTMAWLARTARRRADVRSVLPSARSVIVTASRYDVGRPAASGTSPGEIAVISRHAWGTDYHGVIGRRLDGLLAWMREAHAEPFEAFVFVDSGPVQERVYARHAGLGWFGKNCCLVDADLGSWVFLGVIVCSVPLEPDAPVPDRCGACTACLDACPTGALVEPHVLDARRCLAYLTIEHRGVVPLERRREMDRHVYGCDICQDVCPWNAPAPAGAAPEWEPRAGLDRPRLVDLWRRSDAELAALIEGTSMARMGLVRLRRNLAVAIGNSDAPDGAAALSCWNGPAERQRAPSAADPLVREHVTWALGRATF